MVHLAQQVHLVLLGNRDSQVQADDRDLLDHLENLVHLEVVTIVHQLVLLLATKWDAKMYASREASLKFLLES
ncbi:unnamed protein product [Wuchereria bancrofti]|uniref:Uncharacterized protein n=1 Tax=Wuchereria bancrofti TaxID=6293 RepID=A0A3P7EEQ5_WUCBA|nr:unnamed protein product [Wuchereria bancrofti]